MPHSSPGISPGKKAALWAGYLLALTAAAALFLEAGSIAYFLLKDKKLAPVAELVSQAEGYYLNHFGSEACSWSDQLQQHPYLGFVYKRQGNCTPGKINSLGLRGPELPPAKDPAEHVILVLGGSVAEMYGAGEYLSKELNEKFTSGKIKRFRVIVGAIGAWRIAQQNALFALLAGRVDSLVVLNGYNEALTLSGQSNIDNPTFDIGARYFRGLSFNLSRSLRFYLNGKMFRLQRENILFRNSRFLFLLSSGVRNWARGLALKEDILLETARLEDELPPFPAADISPVKQGEFNFDQFFYYLRSMQALADAHKVKAFYFLQPIPGIGKPLTAEEASAIKGRDYKELYTRLEKRFLALSQQKLAVHSLTQIFSRESGAIFLDEIHLNDQGNKILNRAILEKLGPRLR